MKKTRFAFVIRRTKSAAVELEPNTNDIAAKTMASWNVVFTSLRTHFHLKVRFVGLHSHLLDHLQQRNRHRLLRLGLGCRLELGLGLGLERNRRHLRKIGAVHSRRHHLRLRIRLMRIRHLLRMVVVVGVLHSLLRMVVVVGVLHSLLRSRHRRLLRILLRKVVDMVVGKVGDKVGGNNHRLQLELVGKGMRLKRRRELGR